jgi:hypothetical protein
MSMAARHDFRFGRKSRAIHVAGQRWPVRSAAKDIWPQHSRSVAYWHPNADSWRIKARPLRPALLHIDTKQESWDTKDEEIVMKCSKPVAVAVAVMEDRAVDILIYTLGGISIALAIATGVGVLFFSF